VGILDGGRLVLSASMEALRDRLRRVEVTAQGGAPALPAALPAEWLAVERAGPRVSFLLADAGQAAGGAALREWFPEPARIDLRAASLREIFAALAGTGSAPAHTQEVVR
jgi:hypothetical protein